MWNWRFLTVVGLAFVVRLVWVLLVRNAQYSDSVWYDAAAANLAAHRFYGPDVPSAWFPPGFSFLLAAVYKLVGHSEIAGKFLQVMIGVALTALTYLLGRLVAGETVGLIAAMIVAVWPNLVFSTGILDSDLLAATGFVAVMWLGLRRGPGSRPVGWQALLLGALVGWMVLVRPVSLILLAALAIWWWLPSHSVRDVAVRLAPPVAVVVLVVGGWTLRNYLQFGEVITIATNGGYNFWQTNQPYADGNDTFWPFVPMDDPEYQTMRYGDEFTKNREGYRYAIAFLEAHPFHIVEMLPTKLFWLYHTDTSGLYEGVLYAPMEGPSAVASWFTSHERIVEPLTFRYYELVVALAVLGAILMALRGGANNWIWPLLSLPLLLTFFHLFFQAKDRFHMPLSGVVIAPFAAVAIVETVQVGARWLARSRRLAPTRRHASSAR
jgi:4-amino-4-deoxy-L-arabinose transferase-like glycosyltransferase